MAAWARSGISVSRDTLLARRLHAHPAQSGLSVGPARALVSARQASLQGYGRFALGSGALQRRVVSVVYHDAIPIDVVF